MVPADGGARDILIFLGGSSCSTEYPALPAARHRNFENATLRSYRVPIDLHDCAVRVLFRVSDFNRHSKLWIWRVTLVIVNPIRRECLLKSAVVSKDSRQTSQYKQVLGRGVRGIITTAPMVMCFRFHKTAYSRRVNGFASFFHLRKPTFGMKMSNVVLWFISA